MELLQLRYFVAAAQSNNFSKVAGQFYIPQSAVSSTIAKLERELNCKLFDRIGKRVILNSNGRLFLEAIEPSLASIDQAVLMIKTHDERPSVDCQINSGTRLMLELFKDFHIVHSHISINVYSKNASDDYQGLSIMSLPISDNYDYHVLMTDIIKVALPSNHQLAGQKVIDLRLLEKEQFVGFSKDMPIRTITDNLCLKRGFSPKIVFECHDSALLRELLQIKQYIAFVPALAWETKPVEGISLVDIDSRDAKRTLVIAWPKNIVLTPEQILFRDYVIGWFKKFN